MAPGTYTVSLSKVVRGETTELVPPQTFDVECLRRGALPGQEIESVVAFWERVATAQRSVSAANQTTEHLDAKIGALKVALGRTRSAPAVLDDQWREIRTELDSIVTELSGNQAMAVVGQEPPANVLIKLNRVITGTANSTYGPTDTHQELFDAALSDFDGLRQRLNTLQGVTIPEFEASLIGAGAPWVAGADIPSAQ